MSRTSPQPVTGAERPGPPVRWAGRSITARVKALLDGARFPRPEDFLSVTAQQLRDAGVSRQKARYLHALAEAFHTGELAGVRFSRLSDEEILRRLTAIVGIGRWTAEMFLMFSMRRPDIFPIDDLGIRRGMEIFFGVDEREEMVQRAEPWRPYRSLASMYLWRAQDTGLVS